MDEDETSIGGLENPPKPTKELFYASLAFDIIGLCLALLVNKTFFIEILSNVYFWIIWLKARKENFNKKGKFI